MTPEKCKTISTQLAYIITEFKLNDASAIKPYLEEVQATFTPYGGRIIVQNNKFETLEGENTDYTNIIVLEFDGLKQAQNWYHSPSYQKLIPIRQKAGKTRMYSVEGIPFDHLKH